MEERALYFEKITNARELGGLVGFENRKVRKNVLIRSGKLDKATDKDKERLINDYKLKYVVDFRAVGERELKPEVTWDGIDFYSFPPLPLEGIVELKKKATNRAELFISMYLTNTLNEGLYSDVVTDSRSKESYQEFFKLLLKIDKDRSVLWHCSAGKDRTGIAAALILFALGVSEKDVIEDYMLTNVLLHDEIEENLKLIREKTNDEKIVEGCRDIAGINIKFIETFINKCKKMYGSVINYIIEGLGVTEEEIDILREKYLEAK